MGEILLISQSAVLLVTPGLFPFSPKASCVLDAAPVEGRGAKALAVANAESAKQMVENFMMDTDMVR